MARDHAGCDTHDIPPGVPIFVEHWGNNLQFYPNFALFSTLGGMNLVHDFVQVSRLSEDQKKGLHQKRNSFSLNSREHLRPDAHQSQIIGGDADVDHTQTIGGGYSQITVGDISPIPPEFWHPRIPPILPWHQSWMFYCGQ